MIKNSPVNAGEIRDVGSSMNWEDSLERSWQPTPVFLPEEPIQKRSLVGYSPWGHKESDMTEATWHAHTFKYIHTYIYI